MEEVPQQLHGQRCNSELKHVSSGNIISKMSIEITKGDSLKERVVYKDDCEVFTSVPHFPDALA